VIAAAAAALAGPGRWSYLKGMARLLSTQQEIVSVSPSSGGMRPVAVWWRARASVWVWAGLALIALCGALVLWFHYGATVFFEMIASGISACF
jgi:hypothetical protein